MTGRLTGSATGAQSDLRMYLRLLGYVAPYRRMFALSLFTMVILAGTAPLVAALFKPALDDVFIGGDTDMIALLPLCVILLFLVRGVASWVSVVSLQWVAERVVMDLRREMFGRLLELPDAYHDRHNAGSIISRFTYDVTQIRQAAGEAVSVLFRDSLYVAGLLAWMFYVDWKMTAIVVVAGPFIVGVVDRIRLRLRAMNRRVQDSMAEIHELLAEVIDGRRVVRIFGGRDTEAERFSRVINANRSYGMKVAVAAAAGSPLVELLVAIALALIIFIAGREALAGTLSIGSFVSFFAAVALLMQPLKRLVRVNEHVQRSLAACESVFSLLDQRPEAGRGAVHLPAIRGEIEIRNLEFGYEDHGRNVLHGVSLRILPGETVAVVGASGSGKSTLAALLPRFYECNAGRIFIDGHDIDEISLASLRGAVSLVSQDVFLFNSTIRGNIAYGATAGASEEEIIAAAEGANAMEFIRTLPQGLDTPIGDRGSRLSGGQRQRIALARALLKRAPILILDEATSAVDVESERQIRRALEEIRGRCTCLVIAHRPSFIEFADRIVVLQQGRIVQAGTHAELAGRGEYGRLYRQEAGRGERGDPG
jgi:subfamily B ATP-binding cassette protein MsbA